MTHQLPMTAQEIVRLNRDYTLFSWSVQSAVSPIPIVRAEGVYFWDADGKRYLDFSSQLMNLNIGHQHPKVVRAILIAFSFASAPPRQKNAFVRLAGVTSASIWPSRPRGSVAIPGWAKHSFAACSWIARTTLGCWWPMFRFISCDEKSR